MIKLALIVDDDRVSHVVVKEILKDLCKDVVIMEAYSGLHAMEIVSGCRKNRYHMPLVIMDQMMPEMDGTDCAHIVKGMGYEGAIVLHTSDKGYSHEIFDDVIYKPGDMGEWENIVDKYLR